MSAASDRTLVRRVLTVLRRSYGRFKVTGCHSPLQELLIGILADGASERKAERALASVEGTFVDWNEVRVSSPHEIAEAMPMMPDAVRKAGFIRAVLGKLFDRTNEMSLEYLRQRSPREAARLVARIPEFPEEALSRVTIHALGHEVFPPTPTVVAVCRHLALMDHGPETKANVRRLQRAIPKQSMMEFHGLLARHGRAFCLRDEPDCMACPLLKDCRTGRATASDSKSTKRTRTVKGTKGKRSLK